MGVVIKTGFTGTDYPLTNPRIGAFTFNGTITAASEAAGFEAENAGDGTTYSAWRPTAVPAWWAIEYAATKTVSYIGIAAHDLATVGASLQIQKWDGATWVNIMPAEPILTPTDNGPILFLFEEIAVDKIRVRMLDVIGTIGVISIGAVTECPVKSQFTGSLPFNEAVQSVFADSLSDGGHVLERFELRKAVPAVMELRNISETWAGNMLRRLSDQLADSAAFFADRPDTYPESVVFGMLAEPLNPARALPVAGASRAVQFRINGFSA